MITSRPSGRVREIDEAGWNPSLFLPIRCWVASADAAAIPAPAGRGEQERLGSLEGRPVTVSSWHKDWLTCRLSVNAILKTKLSARGYSRNVKFYIENTCYFFTQLNHWQPK